MKINSPWLTFFTAGCFLAGCDIDNHYKSTATVSVSAKTEQGDYDQVGWPKDISRLVEHLNDWHKDELIAYNEPENFPNYSTSGETGGWIASHEEELAKLGASVEWDRDADEYVLLDPDRRGKNGG